MRIFDTYFFNIADRVTFARAAAYLDGMLCETGCVPQKTAFSVYAVTPDIRQKALGAFPALAKYAQTEPRNSRYGLTSAAGTQAERQQGILYTDAADRADILSLFGKVPRTLNFPFCTLVLGGVKWFPDSRDDAVPERQNPFLLKDPMLMPERVRCNAVTLHRSWDDGKKRVTVSVCIEVTAAEQPRSPEPVTRRLTPVLGTPYHRNRECLLNGEETAGNELLAKQHRAALYAAGEADLPAPVYQHGMMPREQHAKTALLDRVFRGTGFQKQKGNPTWLSCYVCTDTHGFLYEAYVQRLSSGGFRLWLTVSGYNFSLSPQQGAGADYCGTDADSARQILTQFAAHCVRIRDEYAEKLAGDFGDTPAWFRQSYTDLGE